MSVLFAGPDRMKEWIEPLISSTFLDGDDKITSSGISFDDCQSISKSIPSSSSSLLTKIVQVVRIGRPIHKSNDDTPLSPKMHKRLSLSLNSTDLVLGRMPRSNSTNRLVMNPSRVDETVPTSLLISDGQTTILAILSNETRTSLSKLATDDSFLQNNTITKGCVIKLIDWKLDTLLSACSSTSSKSSLSALENMEDISDKEDDDVDDEINDGAENDNRNDPKPCVSSVRLLWDDPLVREHHQLLHQSTINADRNKHITPENVVVLKIMGSMEVLGGHGMAEAGRPSYIMDTIDVRRATKFLTTKEIYSRILSKNSCLTEYFASRSAYITPDNFVACARRISETTHTDDQVVKKRKLDSGGESVTDKSVSSLPIVEESERDRGVRERGMRGEAPLRKDSVEDDADLPIGNVEELFQSPTQSKLDEIWKTIEEGQKVEDDEDSAVKPRDRSILPSNTSIVPGATSSTTNEYNRQRMKELFKNTGRTRKEKSQPNIGFKSSNESKQSEVDRGVSSDLIEQVEDVMSDEYSSDVSCEDEENANLSIGNMLLSHDEENIFIENEATNKKQLSTHQSKETDGLVSTCEMDARRNADTEAGSTASFIKLSNTLKNMKEPNTRVEFAEHQFIEGKKICDQPLENQPFHLVIASSNAEQNVDDVSVEGDCDNMFALETQEDSRQYTQMDENRISEDEEQFYDALTSEPENDEVESITPLDTNNENDELDEDSEMVLRPLLETQENYNISAESANALESRSNDASIKSQTSIEDVTLEFTYKGWMRAVDNFVCSGRREVDEIDRTSLAMTPTQATNTIQLGGDRIRALLWNDNDNVQNETNGKRHD